MQGTTFFTALILLIGLSNTAPINIQKRTNRYPWVVFPGDPEYSSHDSLWNAGK